MSESTGERTSREGLVRAIGRWSMAALVINCIVGSGVFGLPSVLASLLGRASVVAVVLAAFAVGIIMACFAEVGSRFAQTGGPYLYAQAAFGRFMGIQVAWLVWFVRLTACAANANLFVTYLGEFWPEATRAGTKVAVLTILLGILAAINIRGVKGGTRLSDSFTVAKLGSLAFVCVVGAVYLLSTHKVVPLATVSPDGKQWARAIVLLIFAYGGFEAAVISTGEAKDPRRDLPFALFVALITCSVFYTLIQWVVVGILPDPAHSQRPLADAVRVVLGGSGAWITALGALFSIYGYLSSSVLTTPRITFALAERGDFPAIFGWVHRRFHTPYLSIVVFVSLVWILALLGSFAGNATLSAGSRLFYYGVVCAALPALRKKSAEKPVVQLPFGAFVGVVGAIMCVALLTQIEYNKSLLLLAAVAVAFLNWMAVRKRPIKQI